MTTITDISRADSTALLTGTSQIRETDHFHESIRRADASRIEPKGEIRKKVCQCAAAKFASVQKRRLIGGIQDVVGSRATIEDSRQRAKMRKHKSDESDKLSTVTAPGKLKHQKDWLTFDRGLRNNLSAIDGQGGVNLEYVLRLKDEPYYSNEEDGKFEQLTIACAPLVGEVYKADARKVHQMILRFVQGETAKTWIKHKEKKQDGRLDYTALRAHCGGEGNKTLRIKEAESLRKTLQYKNECAMTFEKFLTYVQRILGQRRNPYGGSEDPMWRSIWLGVGGDCLESASSHSRVTMLQS
jgi:hypothetical protein